MGCGASSGGKRTPAPSATASEPESHQPLTQEEVQARIQCSERSQTHRLGQTGITIRCARRPHLCAGSPSRRGNVGQTQQPAPSPQSPLAAGTRTCPSAATTPRICTSATKTPSRFFPPLAATTPASVPACLTGNGIRISRDSDTLKPIHTIPAFTKFVRCVHESRRPQGVHSTPL